MPGELFERATIETPAVAVSEMEVASHDRGYGGVAVLLAIAAVVAAIIGARASMISSVANDSWQSALRTEVKRSAAAMNDVQTLYQSDLPTADRGSQGADPGEGAAGRRTGPEPGRPAGAPDRSQRPEPARGLPLVRRRAAQRPGLRPAVGRLRPGQTPGRHPS